MASEKKFDKGLYDQNNSLSIIIALNYLISTGHYYYDLNPLEQPETFKESDFVLFLKKNKKAVKIEVERKKTWKKSGQWQGYETLDVPVRKKDSKADLFIMTNDCMDTLAIIKMKDVKGSSVYKKDTIYTKGEEFFAVELDKVKFVKLQWVSIM
jgi:hypothetical protein